MAQIDIAPGETPAEASGYGYIPSETAAIVFVVLFSLSGIAHLVQGLRAKYWIVVPTLCAGALAETLGWAGRLWSARNIMEDTPFLMQISSLIIAPVFFSAYCYTTLGMAITALGPQYSLLTPRKCLIIFLGVDIVSLLAQAVGGGLASGADDASEADIGQNIMLAGIVFQLFSMICFVIIAGNFIYRVRADKPYAFRQSRTPPSVERADSDTTLATVPATAEKINGEIPTASSSERINGEETTPKANHTRWWIFLLGGVGISSFAIILRGVYRTAELSQGWGGSIMHNQSLQNFLDGLPMVVAVAIFNVFNPAYLLGPRSSWKGIH